MLIRIDDWSTLSGRQVEMRLDSRTVCAGIVGEVLADGSVLFIQPFTGIRTAFDKHDSYEAWAAPAPHKLAKGPKDMPRLMGSLERA